MNDILNSAKRAMKLLERRGVPAALVGGLAVSAQTEPRFTRDVDIVVSVAGDEEAEAVIAAMRGIGYVPADLVEQERTGRLATARCVRPSDPEGVVVDLLFASSGIEPEIAAAARSLEISDGFVAPVGSPVHLLAMKVLSRGPERPQDDIDVRALLGVVPAEDLEDVSALLQLIQDRGYARGKSLVEEFESIVADYSDESPSSG